MRRHRLAVVVLQQVRAHAVQHARRPAGERRRVPPVPTPSPPASKPISRTRASPMNAWKMPIAFEPPPTQATTASGSRPAARATCSRASTPITRWKSRTITGNGCGPITVPSSSGWSATLVTQSRIASLIASFSVRLPMVTGTTSAPSSRIRATLSACRRVSSSPM